MQQHQANYQSCHHSHSAFACCPGADSTIADCDSILSDTISWDADKDQVDQRNALIEFYNATGGEYWTSYVLTSSLRDTISGFDAYLVELGEKTSASGFDVSYLSTEYQEVIAAADALSANCTVQRTLQLINLLVKYPWNTASECLRRGCSISVHLLLHWFAVCASVHVVHRSDTLQPPGLPLLQGIAATLPQDSTAGHRLLHPHCNTLQRSCKQKPAFLV